MMGAVADNLQRIKSSLPEGVELVAVSKFHPAEAAREAYAAGQRIFGESRAQELAAKAPALPSDIEWHFIGHLQTNKVRQVVAHASMIQSVDSLRLLREIDREAAKAGRRVKVLIEVHAACEETKTGFAPAEAVGLIDAPLVASLTSTVIAGVMGMASLTDDEARVAADFDAIRGVFDALKAGVMKDNPDFNIVSMGMSDDFHIAVAHGTTMVRIGTDIFGSRV